LVVDKGESVENGLPHCGPILHSFDWISNPIHNGFLWEILFL